MRIVFHLMLVAFPFLVMCLFVYGIYLAFRPYKDEPDDPVADGCDDSAGSEEPTAKEHADKAQDNIDITIPFLIVLLLIVAIPGAIFLLGGPMNWMVDWICGLLNWIADWVYDLLP